MKIKFIVPVVGVGVLVAAIFWYRTAWHGTGLNTDSSSTLVTVEDDDKEMLQAIKTARSTVADFIKRFEHPQSGDTNFSVKKEFEHNGQSEHIWLTNIAYKDGVFTGKVGNEPELVSNVRFGDTATVHRKDISDWMWLTNGKMYGGHTLRALLKSMPKAQADLLRQQYQLE